MNNKNLITTGAAALVAVIAISGLAFSTFAASDTEEISNERGGRAFFGANLTDEQKEEMRANHEERQAEREAHRAEMDEAIEAGYETWAALVAEKNADAQVLEVITADNFADFKAAHDKMQAGHEMIEEARDDMEELGVERGMGSFGQGFKKGMKQGRGMGMHRSGAMHFGEAQVQ